VSIDDMQFGFRPRRGTTDAIFIIRQVQEKFLAKNKELWIAVADLEKAFDRVPREVLWWALRRLGVEEWIVISIKALYEDATTSVKSTQGESKEFGVKFEFIRVHCCSPLCSRRCQWCLKKVFHGSCFKLSIWLCWRSLRNSCWKRSGAGKKVGLEERGLRVNTCKTKVMKCQVRNGLKDDSGDYPCSVCRRNVKRNSIECVVCKKWVHKKCSGVKGKLMTKKISVLRLHR
jgi:hypothetical protein